MNTNGNVYLIPTVIEEEALETIPPYVLEAIKVCKVFFVENERTARRFLKKIWKEIPIDSLEWYTIHKAEGEVMGIFRQRLREGKTVGILSEAGCPGVADPGQLLVAAAHELKATIHPLVGPSSILLALMASGLNGQHFRFRGYLPIETADKIKSIHDMENESMRNHCTQIFIETPYRNIALLETLIKTCRPQTKLCVAVNLSGKEEMIYTRSIAEWKQTKVDLHKKPAIFLLNGGS